MDNRFAPRPWAARALLVPLWVSVWTSTLTIAIGSPAIAQQAPAAQPPSVQLRQPLLTYSPWMKFCLKAPQTNGQQACFTGTEGKAVSGALMISAVMIEREGEAKKLLRVTFPLGMQLPEGTRVIVDSGQPMNAPYVICFASGCMADYEASETMIGNMKRGQRLVVQGFDRQGQGISLLLPLSDFGMAYDGPPRDPKAFAEPQR